MSSSIDRPRHAVAAVCVAIALVCSTAFASSAAASSLTFGYTGADQTYLVPAGVTAVTVDVQGAQGGGSGGRGGRALATLAVTPGEVFPVRVGGRGMRTCAGSRSQTAGGFGGGGNGGIPGSIIFSCGGGGGGGSYVILNGADVVVAGGGGGKGSFGGETAGTGGGLQGGAACCRPVSGGGANTATNTGGAGGNGNGQSGGSHQGGAGGCCGSEGPGGGGGGGYLGGGGGSSGEFNGTPGEPTGGGSGGGGSGYIDTSRLADAAPAAFQENGVREGDGVIRITPVKALGVTTAGSGAGHVDSAPAGIDCGHTAPDHSDCDETYADGTEVTLTAHPEANTDFAGWSGEGCSGTSTSCTLTMDQARSVTATFTLKQRALTVTTEGTGSGFVDSTPAGVDCGRNVSGHADCDDTQVDGTSVTLTAHPAPNTDFAGWSGDGCSGTAVTCTVTMDQARSVTATFTLKQRALKVTTDGTGGGFVDSSPAGVDCARNAPDHGDCEGSYADGSAVTLTVHPDVSSDFAGWSSGGCSGTATSCTVTMDEAHSVSASFGAKPQPDPAAPPQVRPQLDPAAPPRVPEELAQPVAPEPARLVLSHRRVRLSRGSALVGMHCAGAVGQSCAGTVHLRSTTKRSRLEGAGAGRKARFTIRAGARRSLRIALPRATVRQLRRHSKAVVLAIVTGADGTSAKPVAVTVIGRS